MLVSIYQTEERTDALSRGVFIAGEDLMPQPHFFTDELHRRRLGVDAFQVAHDPGAFIEFHQDDNIGDFTLPPLGGDENRGESADADAAL